jgi:hypothetical protein
VELVERLHQRLQEARSGAVIQGNGQAGRLSRATTELARDLRFNLRYSGDHAILRSRRKLTDQTAVARHVTLEHLIPNQIPGSIGIGKFFGFVSGCY